MVKHLLQSRTVVVILTLFLYGIFLLFQLQKAQWNFSQFVYAGSYFVQKSQQTPHFAVHQSYGYDGEFYFRLSRNPFSNRVKAYGIELDSPAYRQQRILYPFIAWILTLGNPNLLPIELVFLNFILLGVMGYVGSLIAQHFHKPPLFGLIFPLCVGFLFTLSYDLTEIMESVLVLIGLYYFMDKRYILSGNFLSLAVLAKETALVVPGVIFLSWLENAIRGRGNKKWKSGLPPLIVYTLYFFWLKFRWGPVWRSEVAANVGIPFQGIFSFIHSLLPVSGHFTLINLFAVMFVFLLFGCCFFVMLRERKFDEISFIWIGCFILAMSLTRHVWVEDRAYLRAVTDGVMVGGLLLLRSKSPLVPFAILFVTLSWIIYAYDLLTARGF